MFLYSIIPFLIMSISNTLIVIKTWYKNNLRQSSQTSPQAFKSAVKMKRATASQLVLSSLFLVMTLPSTFAYGIFIKYKNDLSYLFYVLDYILYLHNSTLFFRCFIAYFRFRKLVIRYLLKFLQPFRNILCEKK